jgi:hypothetical protein
MGPFGFQRGLAAIAAAVIALLGATSPGMTQTPSSRIDEALQNITALVRIGRVGYATFWDGNKYIQCRRTSDRSLRCEAAGTSMQPSLRNVLTGDRLTRLAALGWVLDPSFGNHVQVFSADLPTDRAADLIVQTLNEAYAANIEDLDVKTSWVADTPCPPRNGPSQNLAGIVNDAPSMRATALLTCFYTPPAARPQTAGSAPELIAIYGASTTAEIQRLRVNATRPVYAVFDAGIGYIQCMPEVPPVAIYCEAQSAETWAALTTVLTPERIARLHKAGYTDPGRAPNYSKSYVFDKYKDADIANEILTLLHESYGYTGASKLKITTE